MVTGSLDYTIDVLPDRPPTVQFTKPGRDQKVLSVDEVYTEARAEDDYGVAKLDLVYSVNGGPRRRCRCTTARARFATSRPGYTFMLEGLKLEPGDVVSYYARATDNNAVSGPQRASTDIYFMQVRPYDSDYRQQQGGGGGGGGGGGQQQTTPASSRSNSATSSPRRSRRRATARQRTRKRSTRISRRCGCRSSVCASRRASSSSS